VTNDPGASNRTYLSIGEALDSLKIEFPDVTISKIRFLEGQGLVEPERTPSGYRKFTLVDVERLRWVLRQQQESYIPLKVIRERLAEAESTGLVPRTLPRTPTVDRINAAFTDLSSERPRSLAVDGIDDFDDLGELEDFADPADSGDLRERDDESAFDPNRRLAGSTSLEDDSPESMGEFRHPASRARSANLRPESVRAPTPTPASTRVVSAPSPNSSSSVHAPPEKSMGAPADRTRPDLDSPDVLPAVVAAPLDSTRCSASLAGRR
jgi:DNA-binding transcriptional MerR regulator